MNPRGTGRKVVSFHTTELKAAYLLQRGERLGLGETQFARAIINKWLMDGAPPVDELDAKRGTIKMPADLIDEIQKTSVYRP